MIVRIWHGYTKPENALQYQKLLYEEVWPSVKERKVKGYKGIELIRREHENEVEFITIMRFDNLKDVIEFAGENYNLAYVPQKAKLLLKRYDSHSRHYEQLTSIDYK